ncbi:MAG: hypothetical protein U0X73_02160 [Thermoanaerobaculia bacterium]
MPSAELCLDLLGADRAAHRAAELGERLLLRVDYGGKVEPRSPEGVRVAIPNRVLGAGPLSEIWHSRRAARSFDADPFRWSENGQVLLGCSRRAEHGDLTEATRLHFAGLLDLIARRGYPHLLRVWNYLPAINRGDGDDERYRRFNVGRAAAFAASADPAPELEYPASSAVGSPGSHSLTVFLASARPATHLENPRQVSAFRYPETYGPRPPSFSRATLAAPRPGAAFFLSGTASIVGHATVHAGSIDRQLGETLRNIDAILEQIPRAPGEPRLRLADLDLVKVYLRDADHFEAVRSKLGPALAPGSRAIYLEADVCRRDLLVEIEGSALRAASRRRPG